MDSGSDLVIWTYHFTSFAAYTANSNNNNDNSPSGCKTSWRCDSWGPCNSGTQTRFCSRVDNNCYAGNRPIESQSCTETIISDNNITNKIINSNSTNSKGSGITGAVIGGKAGVIVLVVFIAGLLIAIVAVAAVRARKVK
jgi:hypothetical protein